MLAAQSPALHAFVVLGGVKLLNSSFGMSLLPDTPSNPTVRQGIADALGTPLTITWGRAAGATSYHYVMAYSDGSGLQQGTVTSTSVDVRMPYHWSGKAKSGFVCIRALNPAGQSPDQSCGPLSVPAR